MPASLNPILPLLQSSPRIYNVHFDGDVDVRLTWWKGSVVEMMIWECYAPTDPLDQKQYRDNLLRIDNFLDSATDRDGDDPEGDLIDAFRGRILQQGKPTSTLISLLWWNSPEDEARFKNPQEYSRLHGRDIGWDAADNDKYERCFQAGVKTMEQKGWLVCKEHIHFHVARWEAT